MQPALDTGIPIHMYSVGDIRDLMDDLLETGIKVINLQDLVNGIGWISWQLKGKYCIELDIDRQSATVFGSPAQVTHHIEHIVKTLGSP